MVELAGVSKRYHALQALDGVDLKFPRGETTVLIGPSGCGKSTILRLIVGLIRPDRGRICFEGAQVRPEALLELRRKIGYVIQEGGLFPHLNARDNIELMPRFLKWDRGRSEQRLRELAGLCRFPLSGLERFPVQLSGGERQRVALMRALMLDPQLLLLDEPLGALDPMIRAELQNDLKRIFASLGKSVILVTHDLGEAAFFGDLVVLIDKGRIVQSGPPHELLQRPATPFVTAFINAQRSPWKNLEEG